MTLPVPAHIDRALDAIDDSGFFPHLPATIEDAYEIRANLEPYIRALYRLRDWLDELVRADMEEREATERRIGTVVYSLKADASGWQIPDKYAMLHALSDLADAGEIGRDEFEAVVSVTEPQPIVNIDNGKLNTLIRKRGKPVSEVVDPLRMRGLPGPAKFSIREAA